MFSKITGVVISLCKSNHYAVYLKFMQCCIPIISQLTCKKNKYINRKNKAKEMVTKSNIYLHLISL